MAVSSSLWLMKIKDGGKMMKKPFLFVNGLIIES